MNGCETCRFHKHEINALGETVHTCTQPEVTEPGKPRVLDRLATKCDGWMEDTVMTLNEYQDLAQVTAQITDIMEDKIINGCMGMNGEAGECIDLLKKYLFQGHKLNKDKLMDECGDVLWYVAETARGLGYTLQEVAEHNIIKLKTRYPEGFDSWHSIHRKEGDQE